MERYAAPKKKSWDLYLLTWKDDILLNIRSSVQPYIYGNILFSDSKKQEMFKRQVYISLNTMITYHFHNLEKKNQKIVVI